MKKSEFLKKQKSDNVARDRSPKQEKELALHGGGTLTPGSGNKWRKGDVEKYLTVYRLEAKTTAAQSFRVTREMVEKIETAALAHSQVPAIIVEFLNEQGEPEMEVAVVPSWVLPRMVEKSD